MTTDTIQKYETTMRRIIIGIGAIASLFYIVFIIQYEIKSLLKVEWIELDDWNQFIFLFLFLKINFNFLMCFESLFALCFPSPAETKITKFEKTQNAFAITFYTGLFYMHYSDCRLNPLLQSIVSFEINAFFFIWKIIIGLLVMGAMAFIGFLIFTHQPDGNTPIVLAEAYVVEEEPNIIQAVLAQ